MIQTNGTKVSVRALLSSTEQKHDGKLTEDEIYNKKSRIQTLKQGVTLWLCLILNGRDGVISYTSEHIGYV